MVSFIKTIVVRTEGRQWDRIERYMESRFNHYRGWMWRTRATAWRTTYRKPNWWIKIRMITNQTWKTGATVEGGKHDIDFILFFDTDFTYAEFDWLVPYLGGTWKYGSQKRLRRLCFSSRNFCDTLILYYIQSWYKPFAIISMGVLCFQLEIKFPKASQYFGSPVVSLKFFF